ncbi:hypothetical protein Bbelb_243220 [Branchiostoma belcheri]|nr:hypothetical protein Bbelb_243220 [Branchiostoma belcheri]
MGNKWKPKQVSAVASVKQSGSVTGRSKKQKKPSPTPNDGNVPSDDERSSAPGEGGDLGDRDNKKRGGSEKEFSPAEVCLLEAFQEMMMAQFSQPSPRKDRGDTQQPPHDLRGGSPQLRSSTSTQPILKKFRTAPSHWKHGGRDHWQPQDPDGTVKVVIVSLSGKKITIVKEIIISPTGYPAAKGNTMCKVLVTASSFNTSVNKLKANR